MQQFLAHLSTKKIFHLKAAGNSMRPAIYADDVVYLKKVAFRKININDIILVRKGQKAFIHRVIYKWIPYQVRDDKMGYLITKGDNNPKSDGKIYPQHVLGKVYQLKRNHQLINPQDINLYQSTLYFQELIKLKTRFYIQKVNYVFLKGLPLHLYYQKSHPGRVYADCDFLISKSDYQKAKKILLNLGFQKADTAFSPIHKLLKDKPTELSFYKSVNKFPIVLDVHFEPVFLMNQLGRLDALYPQCLIDKMTDEMLETKRQIIIQGEKFLILNSKFLILYLALHFFHHNFQGVFRLELLEKVIRRSLPVPPPSEEFLRATSEAYSTLSIKIRHFQLQNFVYPVFLILEKYYDLRLPKRFLETIKPKEKSLNYIKKNILTINIFDDEQRLKAGINRFKNLFYLSPSPFIVRLLIVINPQVIYSFVWVIIRLVKRSLTRLTKSV